EICQDAQAYGLALLGMELGGEDMPPPDAGNEFRTSVIGSGGNDLRVVRHGIVGVHEIGRRAISDAIEVRSAALDVELIPAHVRDFPSVERGQVETHDLTFENVESIHPTKFHTLREENLHAHADAKQRRTLSHNVIDRIHQATFYQPVHAGAKRSHSREDHPSSSFNTPCIACDLRRVAHFLEALLHTAQVAHTVIDDGNHSDRHYFVPDAKNQGDSFLAPHAGGW